MRTNSASSGSSDPSPFDRSPSIASAVVLSSPCSSASSRGSAFVLVLALQENRLLRPPLALLGALLEALAGVAGRDSAVCSDSLSVSILAVCFAAVELLRTLAIEAFLFRGSLVSPTVCLFVAAFCFFFGRCAHSVSKPRYTNAVHATCQLPLAMTFRPPHCRQRSPYRAGDW